MRLLSVLKSVFLGDPVRRYYTKLQDAQVVCARHESEMEFSRAMANFFTMRVTTLDPNKHWWEFAEAKDKQVEYLRDLARHKERSTNAQAVLEARYDQYMAALADVENPP